MRESFYWLLQLITGALILVLLAIHMTVIHLDAVLAYFGIHTGDVLSYAAVTERGRSPAWLVLYLALLLVALYHGLYGLRSVLIEVFYTRRSGRLVTTAVIIIGLIAFAYGTLVTVKSFVG
mgnify:CR=1 FL=1